MSLEENKAIVHRMYDTLNKQDLASRLALMDELVADDFVEHTEKLQGREAFKQFHTQFSKGFSDIDRTIEDIITEGDKVWIHFKVTGTHTGEWAIFGITLPPTGKKVTYTGVGIWRIVDGKVVERKSVRDMLDFLKQLGVIEYTEKAKKIFPEDVEA